MKRLLFVLVLATVVFAGAGCKSVGLEYVDADEATYNAIAPDYAARVNADPALDAEQKARRIRLLDSWRIRWQKAREALK